ncbi:SirB2 family protein [Marinobacteraceae bacterium S3BR75-40.1]
MHTYLTLKAIHVTCVAVTFTLFLLRGGWMVGAPHNLEKRWVKIAPHLVDTLLLASALGMLWVAHLNPLDHSWLMTKITGLIVYIGLGTFALKRGKTRTVRVSCFVLAVAVFLYIVSVALHKSPWPF